MNRKTAIKTVVGVIGAGALIYALSIYSPNGLANEEVSKQSATAAQLALEPSSSTAAFVKASQHPKVQAVKKGYAADTTLQSTLAKRSQPYAAHIIKEIKVRDLPPELIVMPWIESNYNPNAVSHAGATGVWQLMPILAKEHGIKHSPVMDERKDVTISTRVALDHLQKLVTRFHGDWLLAMAAYNAGATTIKRAMQKNEKRGLPTDFWSLSLPKETQMYVVKILAMSSLLAESEKRTVLASND